MNNFHIFFSLIDINQFEILLFVCCYTLSFYGRIFLKKKNSIVRLYCIVDNTVPINLNNNYRFEKNVMLNALPDYRFGKKKISHTVKAVIYTNIEI